ncbi:MAG TPA: uroporphyrinogen-III C-methyltransferase [Burkholderiaceae bacterium]|nr:uroporphyrinogen-III C-methyltransferase [Burkholderiaceae bacterium]
MTTLALHPTFDRIVVEPHIAAARSRGRVCLLGAGPGDPELLTLRGLRRLREADAVVYDHLVAPETLELASEHAQRIYVGKQDSRHSMPQEAINALLVALARQGNVVVRLKGGDPFVFGRGGEEASHLARCGVPFEVVPGVTAASGAAASACIPLTHRDHAHACVFVTGHRRDGATDWARLARGDHTLVVYMGLSQLRGITAELLAHGMPADTPAAAIEAATTRRQCVVVASLATLADDVRGGSLKPPTIVIIGAVVALRRELLAAPQHDRAAALAD